MPKPQIVKKITTGYVVQEFDPKTGNLLKQSFSSDAVDWKDENDNPLDGNEYDKLYAPFDMVQPIRGKIVTHAEYLRQQELINKGEIE